MNAPSPSSTATEEPNNSGFFHDGIDEALTLLCKFLGIDPGSINWDAATETVEGDVSAVIGNIFRAKFGEDWGPDDPAQRTGDCGDKDYIISQHIGWLKQYVEGMTEANWHDMRLRAERQLSEISRDLDAKQPTQGGDKGEAVAWRWNTRADQRWRATIKRPVPTELTAFDKIEPLYAAPQPASNTESAIQNLRQQITDLQRTVVDTNERYHAAAYAWEPADFWKFVSGLAGEFEADQMRDMLAQRGLQIVGMGDPAYAAKEPADAEAVAKAMYDWQFGAGTWDASQSSMKDHYVGLARAAISSLSSTHHHTPETSDGE